MRTVLVLTPGPSPDPPRSLSQGADPYPYTHHLHPAIHCFSLAFLDPWQLASEIAMAPSYLPCVARLENTSQSPQPPPQSCKRPLPVPRCSPPGVAGPRATCSVLAHSSYVTVTAYARIPAGTRMVDLPDPLAHARASFYLLQSEVGSQYGLAHANFEVRKSTREAPPLTLTLTARWVTTICQANYHRGIKSFALHRAIGCRHGPHEARRTTTHDAQAMSASSIELM
ncbi:hypothetical protein K466DRAFT_161617 [Polyporus arcularius HHB13444]|uniref:Uncharacterized protein n=1 Tax=Polyporus arcularius HHB13444 TaxID=1314778 RepID=A0A5C3PUJ9_9APHY|nr:hypothetical protein K466DRAFT_161617 [Polyporus arcularius HHB13444]